MAGWRQAVALAMTGEEIEASVLPALPFDRNILRHFWRWRGKVETKRLVQTAHVRDWLK
jgi:hypothetical protein